MGEKIRRRNIGRGVLGPELLAVGDVDARHIRDGTIQTLDIADGQITAGKLGAKAVETAKINDKAVETGQIGDLAVTAGQIGAAAVTEGKVSYETANLVFGAGDTTKTATITAGNVIIGYYISAMAGSPVTQAWQLGIAGTTLTGTLDAAPGGAASITLTVVMLKA